ncbi:MAG: hypothetical protein ACTSRS_13235, partial [Candidatus Helarchaeota archaeon]
MSYKIPKLTDKKKLCPRCGSPMMQKSETVKYCPVCHFSESSVKTTLKIKMEEEKETETVPKVEILKVTKAGTTKEMSLESEYSYVVVDRAANVLWIWKGAKSSPGDAYKAGVETTRLKSSLKMYSAQVKRVDEGDEPIEFLSLQEQISIIEEKGKQKEEEERKHREEEERKHREEEERKHREEEERKHREEEERK